MHALRLEWDESFLGYNFGPGHPMAPVRLKLTHRLLRDLGLLDLPGVQVRPAIPADDDVLLTVHTPEFVDAVRQASQSVPVPAPWHWLGTDDVPVFEKMHQVSATIVGASLDAALAVWRGEAAHGVNFAGGLHHAMPDAASGFCVYNDVAIAIKALLAAGAERVAYVDVDVHHGDGVERIFWDDRRVMTISVHESGQVLFPGTGYANEIGGPGAPGDAVNLPLPPGASDEGWLRAFHAVVPPLLRSFRPEILITQHGCDSHALDPLAHMALSLDCQRISYEVLHQLSHELCEGRWMAVGGGGYAVVDVVPRAWAHLVGIAAHHPIPAETEVPASWRAYVQQAYGHNPPLRMTDGRDGTYADWAKGHDTGEAIDRAVMATRRAVFPLHGLDPWYD